MGMTKSNPLDFVCTAPSMVIVEKSLEVSSSNNDPGIITKYCLDYVRQIGGTSRVIRADRGTENGNIAVTQQFFRRLARDDFGAEKSFMYGRSTANQKN